MESIVEPLTILLQIKTRHPACPSDLSSVAPAGAKDEALAKEGRALPLYHSEALAKDGPPKISAPFFAGQGYKKGFLGRKRKLKEFLVQCFEVGSQNICIFSIFRTPDVRIYYKFNILETRLPRPGGGPPNSPRCLIRANR